MLVFSDFLTARRAARLGVRSDKDAVLDPRGWTLRCTPDRQTIVRELPSGVRLYRKISGATAGRAEWRALHRLAAAGFSVPRPAYLAVHRRRSVVAFFAVPGRSLEASAAEAVAHGRGLDRIVNFAIQRVAPEVRRLHDLGFAYRDLYWGHLFADLTDADGGFHWIDVGRLLRPRFRRRRWLVKDLAGLLASVPRRADGRPVVRRTEFLRFLKAYLAAGSSGPTRRRSVDAAVGGRATEFVAAITAKAARIRGHRPKYGATQAPHVS